MITYTLAVSVPQPTRYADRTPGAAAGGGLFAGPRVAIELTALVATHFQQLTSAQKPRIAVVKVDRLYLAVIPCC
ncbi:MAG: hypothetical protein WKG07_48775 [Hymenobacter sp.]